jgi:hypothetical protein
MSKRSVCVLTAVCVALIFVAGSIYAGSEVKDVILLKTPEYEEHTKGIVEFSHKKHVAEYGATCGDCHHDDKGKPLALEGGESVQRCVECHKETGKKPKGEKLSKKEKIMKYHKEALHANCSGCHKDWNKEKGYKKSDPKAAPTTCKNCHPKKGA